MKSFKYDGLKSNNVFETKDEKRMNIMNLYLIENI